MDVPSDAVGGPHPGVGEPRDPLSRMTAYSLAVELVDECWRDVERIKKNWTTRLIAPQLYRAAVSISANIAEGYSRSSGRDRVRFFEYALGSARECRTWYEASRCALPPRNVHRQIEKLGRICRILLSIIPRERDRELGRAKR
jgi:four helix bundle protein